MTLNYIKRRIIDEIYPLVICNEKIKHLWC